MERERIAKEGKGRNQYGGLWIIQPKKNLIEDRKEIDRLKKGKEGKGKEKEKEKKEKEKEKEKGKRERNWDY